MPEDRVASVTEISQRVQVLSELTEQVLEKIFSGGQEFWSPFYAFVKDEIAKIPEPTWIRHYKHAYHYLWAATRVRIFLIHRSLSSLFAQKWLSAGASHRAATRTHYKKIVQSTLVDYQRLTNFALLPSLLPAITFRRLFVSFSVQPIVHQSLSAKPIPRADFPIGRDKYFLSRIQTVWHNCQTQFP